MPTRTSVVVAALACEVLQKPPSLGHVSLQTSLHLPRHSLVEFYRKILALSFVFGGSGREHAVASHLGDGELFAVALDDFCGRGVAYGRSPLAWVGLYSGGDRLR